MNEDRIVSYKIAKLLKEKGFDWNCYAIYDTRNPNGFVYEASEEATHCDFDNVNIFNNSSTEYDFLIAAPTQSLAQKWLREVHNINILVTYEFIDDSEIAYAWNIVEHVEEGFNRKKDVWDFYKSKSSITKYRMWYNTYEEALEEGIIEALMSILIKKK